MTDLNAFPTDTLVAIYNALPVSRRVRKFETRKIALRRTSEALARFGKAVDGSGMIVEPVAEAPAKAKEPEGVKAPRAGSKNAIMLSMVLREGGASEQEICEALGWKACAVTLRRVVERSGHELKCVKVGGQKRGRYFAV